MKTLILCSAMLLFFYAVSAQSDKYTSAMKKDIAQIESATVNKNEVELANNFTRIAEAEKNQWLPYYYAAYLLSLKAVTTPGGSVNDELADQAEKSLNAAQQILGKENSEIYVVKAMIATARLLADPQTRYMTYGQEIADDIEKSKSLDPTNPRPILFEGQNLFFTPEYAGGGKEVAKPYFEKAQQLFMSFKPESELSPNWGRSTLDFFMENYK